MRAMAIVGGAQAADIAVALVRVKAVALLLGPSGVAVLAAFNGLVASAASVAELGMRSSAVRELAAAAGDPATLARVRRVLVLALALQAVPAMLALWLLREPLALWLLADPAYAPAVGLLSVAVLLATLSAAQGALLQGLRRIGDLARVTVCGALAATVAGLAAVTLAGADGLVAFVLAQPLATLLVGALFVRRLPRAAAVRMGAADVWRTWAPMARLGLAFMLGGATTALTLLAVRTLIVHAEGLAAAGAFAAAWTLTVQYVGFLLAAMGADYYPRLAAVIGDGRAATALINAQLQLGLAVGGPVLLATLGLAPVAVWLLYSADFAAAVPILQWQLLGNVFKLASWPLGFALLAAGRGGAFVVTELMWNALFLGLVAAGLPVLGVGAAGPAFVLAYGLYLLALWGLLARAGFVWEPLSVGLLLGYAAAAAALLALAFGAAPAASGAAGVLAAVAGGGIGLPLALRRTGRGGRIAGRPAARPGRWSRGAAPRHA